MMEGKRFGERHQADVEGERYHKESVRRIKLWIVWVISVFEKLILLLEKFALL